MEPLNDKELNQLLRTWDAPPAPSALEERVFAAKKSWWKWLFTGTIRVPVPIVVAVLLLIAVWIRYSRPGTAQQAGQTSTVSLTDFKPVPQLQPVLVSGREK